jgi:hypothetical protein
VDMVFMPASRHRMLYDPFFVLVMSLLFTRLFLPTQNPAPVLSAGSRNPG